MRIPKGEQIFTPSSREEKKPQGGVLVSDRAQENTNPETTTNMGKAPQGEYGSSYGMFIAPKAPEIRKPKRKRSEQTINASG